MPSPSVQKRAWARFKANRAAVISAWFLVIAGLATLLGPLFWPYEPDAISDHQFAPPNIVHWFGTDVHGRDMLARLLYGTRISLMVGAVGAGVSLVIGSLWGSIAGYIGGRLDGVMMRIVDVLYSLPSIIFVIVLITGLNSVLERAEQAGLSAESSRTIQVLGLFAGLGFVSWLTMARVVRGQVLSLRNQAFVEASRALGAGHIHILLRHILPNVSGVIIVYLALTIPSVVLYESFLSYLGLGIQPPKASLGSLIAEGACQINPIRTYWWLIIFPALTLATILLALNFVGDGLRDALSPRTTNLSTRKA